MKVIFGIGAVLLAVAGMRIELGPQLDETEQGIEQTAIAQADEAKGSVPWTVESIAADSPLVGDGPVKLVEFYDYMCPHCRTQAFVMEEFHRLHPDVAVAYKVIASRRDSHSLLAARYALASAKQGKFYAMHHKLMELARRETLTEEGILAAAAGIGLDRAQLKADSAGEDINRQIDAHRSAGKRVGISNLPAFAYGRRAPGYFNGEQSIETLMGAIERAN
ncbi:MAG: DsbA family protein [Chlamydiia bacterium]|nr:DsbA family protein [Chlamydiia bacterium]